MGTSTLWLCYFPNCITLPCSNCNFSLTQQQHHHLLQPTTTSISFTHFQLRASQTNNNNNNTRTRTRSFFLFLGILCSSSCLLKHKWLNSSHVCWIQEKSKAEKWHRDLQWYSPIPCLRWPPWGPHSLYQGTLAPRKVVFPL